MIVRDRYKERTMANKPGFGEPLCRILHETKHSFCNAILQSSSHSLPASGSFNQMSLLTEEHRLSVKPFAAVWTFLRSNANPPQSQMSHPASRPCAAVLTLRRAASYKVCEVCAQACPHGQCSALWGSTASCK